MTCCQRAGSPCDRTIRCVSWQTVHFASMMALPSPSGRREAAPAAAASASSPRSPGCRPGQAGGSAGARASVSARSTDADLPAATSTGADSALCCSPPIACTTYLPAGSRALVNLPSAWVMTMKLRRRSAFFICTNAPATGAPAASLMTPVSVPASCADAEGAQKTEAANANAVKCSFDLPDFSTAILLGFRSSLSAATATVWGLIEFRCLLGRSCRSAASEIRHRRPTKKLHVRPGKSMRASPRMAPIMGPISRQGWASDRRPGERSRTIRGKREPKALGRAAGVSYSIARVLRRRTNHTLGCRSIAEHLRGELR